MTERMDEGAENAHDVERADFLKMVGAAGLAGAAALFGGQAVAAAGEEKGKYVVVITHGAEDPNRAVFALLMAQVTAKKGWGKVHVWMTLQGAELACREKTARIVSPIFSKFGNALEIMEDIRERGGWFGVCPPCAEYAGAVGDAKHEWVEKAAGDWLMDNIRGAHVLWM